MNEIIEGMARALHVNAWANIVDEVLESKNDVPPEEWQTSARSLLAACGREVTQHVTYDNLRSACHPGQGGEWMDAAPDTTEEAIRSAHALHKAVVIGSNLDALVNASYLDDPMGLGHYLAMEAISTGVSWEDDPNNEPHGLAVPSWEFSYYVGDDGKLHAYSS